VVASVASVGKTNRRDPDGFSDRLKAFDPGRLRYLIIDEVHHAVNEIYANVMKYFRLYKPEPRFDHPGRLLLGVTATSNRGDGVGLETILDKIVFSRDIREMIEKGWLTTTNCYRIETFVELDQVKVVHGDFQTGQLELAVNTPERNKLIVDKYRELGRGKSGVAFTVDIAHSHDLTAEFRKAGITAMPLSGNTPDEERKRIFAAHKNREVTVIVSCGIVNEGVDIPWCEVGMMARPTRSNLLYTQQLGRLLRKFPAPESGDPPIKTTCTILDFSDLCLRHRPMSVPSLFGLRPDFDLKGQSVTDALSEIESAQAKFKQLSLASFRDLATMHSLVEKIDLFRPPEIPEVARQYSRYAWVSSTNESYRLAIPDGPVLVIRQNALGGFDVGQVKNGLRIPLRDNVDIRKSFEIGDSMVPVEAKILLSHSANWRNEPPSDKQIRRLASLNRDLFSRFERDLSKFSTYVRSTFTKGEVSSMISERTQ
jgi:hypothetical protein